MNYNSVSEFSFFYKQFSKMVQQQSRGDMSIVSFIELSSHVDVLFLRKFIQYFNRFNKKSINILYGKGGIQNIFFSLYGRKNYFSSFSPEFLVSSSRGIIVYTKDYKIFSLLLDVMARSNLNYVVKSVFHDSQKSSSFAELVLSFNPERLFTAHSIKKYKLLSLSRFFIGGFLLSLVLRYVYKK